MSHTKTSSVAQIKLCKFILYLATGIIYIYEAGTIDWSEIPIAQLDLKASEIKLVRNTYTDEYYKIADADELNRIRKIAIQHIKTHNLNYKDISERMLVTINTVGHNVRQH